MAFDHLLNGSSNRQQRAISAILQSEPLFVNANSTPKLRQIYRMVRHIVKTSISSDFFETMGRIPS